MYSESIRNLVGLRYDEYDSFLANLDKHHAQIQKNRYDRHDEIVLTHIRDLAKREEIPPAFSVPIRGFQFHCLFIKGSSNGLNVIYNGARRLKNLAGDYEMYAPRLSYNSLFDSSFLFIDDPMYYEYENLKLGWYYGTEDLSCLVISTALIRILEKKLDCRRSDTLLFSSSGGGYCSLFASCYLPGSLSISINPQLVLKNYGSYKPFRQITGYNLDNEDRFLRNNLPALVARSRSRHVIIVNSRCREDMTEQLIPFLEPLEISPAYGLTQKGNLLIWIYDALGHPYPHTSFETRQLFLGIHFIARAFQKGADLTFLNSLAFLINEIWHERYLLLNQLAPKNDATDILVTPAAWAANYKLEKILENFNMAASEHAYNHRQLWDIKPCHAYKVKFEFRTPPTISNFPGDFLISHAIVLSICKHRGLPV